MKKAMSLLLSIIFALSMLNITLAADKYNDSRENKHNEVDVIVYSQKHLESQGEMTDDILFHSSGIVSGDNGEGSLADYEASLTEEDWEFIRQKEIDAENVYMAATSARWGRDIYKTLSVPCFEQENDWYCGPATVKQVIEYIDDSSSSQGHYAKKLGTTTDGTDMTKIPDVINNGIEKDWYTYTKFEDFERWERCVLFSVEHNHPAILDINTNGIDEIPYNSSGHFVNISGINIFDVERLYDVRITDPWKHGLGNKWYTGDSLYRANRQHFRSAIIW